MVCQNPFPPFSLGADTHVCGLRPRVFCSYKSRDQSAKAIEPQRHASH
jgi:hypothetical protein